MAIGFQDVDGLAVSSYLRENARAYVAGAKRLEEVGSLVRSHHKAGNDVDHLEADLVSQRIAGGFRRSLHHSGRSSAMTARIRPGSLASSSFMAPCRTSAVLRVELRAGLAQKLARRSLASRGVERVGRIRNSRKSALATTMVASHLVGRESVRNLKAETAP